MSKGKLKEDENKNFNKVNQLINQITSNIMGRKQGKKYQYNDVEKKRLLVELIRSGQSLKEAAVAVGIKTNTAKTIMYRYRVNGDKLIIKRRGGGRATKLNSNVLKSIADIVSLNPNITFNGIRQKLLHTEQITLSMGSIKNAIDKIKRNRNQIDDQKMTTNINENSMHIESNCQPKQPEQIPQEDLNVNESSNSVWEYVTKQCRDDDEEINVMQYLNPTNENYTNRTELLLEQLLEEQKKTNKLLSKTIQLLYYSRNNKWQMDE